MPVMAKIALFPNLPIYSFIGSLLILNGHFMRHFFPALCCGFAGLFAAASAFGDGAAAPAPYETPVLAGLPVGVAYTDGDAPHTKIVTQTDQTKLRSIIDWQSFNIGTDAEVIFKSAHKSHITVNRVTGGGTDPSRIYGKLSADGIVIILDPNGVFFSQTAVIDVGGIVASTGRLANRADFENGAPLQLTGMDAVSGARVQNDSLRFTIRDAGLAAFVAPAVQNNGIITARLGHVALASGTTTTLDFFGDRMLNIAVNDGIAAALPDGQSQIDNPGKIIARGGTVQMTARAASAAIDTVINSDGLVVATHAEARNGKIILSDGKTPDRTMTNSVRVGQNTTIQEGIDAAAEGNSVLINGGTYAESLRVTKPLTLAAFDASPVAIFGRSGDVAPAAISVQAPHVTIDGIRILNGYNGIFAENADGLQLMNSFISRSASHGIYLRNSRAAHDFENGAGNVFGSDIGGKNIFIEGILPNPDNTRIFNVPAFGRFAAAPLVIEQAVMSASALAALAPAGGGDDDTHCAIGSACTGNGGSGGN